MTPDEPVYLIVPEEEAYTTGWVDAGKPSVLTIEVDSRKLLEYAIFFEIVSKDK